MSAWECVERLDTSHDVDSFSCGEPVLDAWLHDKARTNQHVVATYVCLDETGIVRAFFALSFTRVDVASAPSRLRANARGGETLGILLAQMGVSAEDRGTGKLGRELLREAMTIALGVHDRVPVQLFVVDALNDALAVWYEKAGFKRIHSGSLRLAIPMKAVRQAVLTV